MALKDWKRDAITAGDTVLLRWKKSVVHIITLVNDGTDKMPNYYLNIFPQGKDVDFGKSKAKAIKFAKSYMEKH